MQTVDPKQKNVILKGICDRFVEYLAFI